MNGDWIDGTGLSIDGDPSTLIPLLEKMPFDVINTGNHELYKSSVVEYMTRPGGFIDWWGKRHLSSNILLKSSSSSSPATKPLSNRYIVLHGNHHDVLVFGFIYNLQNPSELITVSNVEDVVKQSWFSNALKQESYDSILIMAHMGHDDPLVDVILSAIRHVVGTFMPIQFITGHTHYRRYGIKDTYSTSIESGRFLDTVGFISFPTQNTVLSTPSSSSAASSSSSSSISNNTSSTNDNDGGSGDSSLFSHVFLDANVQVLRDTLGFMEGENDQFETANGRELTTFIDETRSKLGLTARIGCAPQDYYINRTMHSGNGDHHDSLWRLYKEQVVPATLFPNDVSSPKAILVSQGSWRYDLLGGNDLQADDMIAVDPFNEPVYYLGSFPIDVVVRLNTTLNYNATVYYEQLPNFILAGDIDGMEGKQDEIETFESEFYVQQKPIKLYTHQFKLDEVHSELSKLVTTDTVISPPELTTLSSTIMWLSFVEQAWPCSGGGSSTQHGIPPWHHQDGKNDSTTSRGGLDDDSLALFLVLLVGTFLIVGVVSFLICCRRRYCTDTTTLPHSERDAFRDNDESESDSYSDISSEDHEDDDEDDGDYENAFT